MATDTRKVILGAALLAISTVLILGTGAIDIGIPAAAGALAALGLAAGASSLERQKTVARSNRREPFPSKPKHK